MNDSQIRVALKTHILANAPNPAEIQIIDEVGIGHGVSRIDLLVVGTCLHGFEIKSDRDNLTRLPTQVRYYSAVFDRVTLVVSYCHAYEALQIIPRWWGAMLVHEREEGIITLEDARDPGFNPDLDIHQVVKLLWRKEALALLDEENKVKGFRSKPRNAVYEKVTEVVGQDKLRAFVRYQLKHRTNWRAVASQE